MRVGGATIAVTGATGFLGSHIALDLLERGANVVGVVRNPDKAAWLAERGMQLRKADLLDRSSLQAAFKDVDAIVSNAALFTMQRTRYRDFLGPNKEGTLNVFQAAAAAGVENHEARRATEHDAETGLEDQGTTSSAEHHGTQQDAKAGLED